MLRVGGVYADVDTECRQPMDGVLRANDSMVVGWENEFDSPAEAEHRHYVRSRQVRPQCLTPPTPTATPGLRNLKTWKTGSWGAHHTLNDSDSR